LRIKLVPDRPRSSSPYVGLNNDVWLSVSRFLSQFDMVSFSRVSREFNDFCRRPVCWSSLKLDAVRSIANFRALSFFLEVIGKKIIVMCFTSSYDRSFVGKTKLAQLLMVCLPNVSKIIIRVSDDFTYWLGILGQANFPNLQIVIPTRALNINQFALYRTLNPRLTTVQIELTSCDPGLFSADDGFFYVLVVCFLQWRCSIFTRCCHTIHVTSACRTFVHTTNWQRF